MADENEKILMELVRMDENSTCADCIRQGECSTDIIDKQLDISALFFRRCVALAYFS